MLRAEPNKSRYVRGSYHWGFILVPKVRIWGISHKQYVFLLRIKCYHPKLNQEFPIWQQSTWWTSTHNQSQRTLQSRLGKVQSTIRLLEKHPECSSIRQPCSKYNHSWVDKHHQSGLIGWVIQKFVVSQFKRRWLSLSYFWMVWFLGITDLCLRVCSLWANNIGYITALLEQFTSIPSTCSHQYILIISWVRGLWLEPSDLEDQSPAHEIRWKWGWIFASQDQIWETHDHPWEEHSPGVTGSSRSTTNFTVGIRW